MEQNSPNFWSPNKPRHHLACSSHSSFVSTKTYFESWQIISQLEQYDEATLILIFNIKWLGSKIEGDEMEFQAPRGTTDVLPDDQRYWRYVENTASQVAESFGYRRIDTPVFEDTNLYIRSIGDSTDIVEKETLSLIHI